MSRSHFENYLKDQATDSRKGRLFIVCGAGIHGLVSDSFTGTEYEASQMLSSWNKLLDVIWVTTFLWGVEGFKVPSK